MVKIKSRKEINKAYDKKRQAKLRINAIRDVPETTIKQLSFIAKTDGTIKAAILNAIADRYQKIREKP